MLTPDINVLVAAFRRDHPQHNGAERWLTGAIEAAAVDDALEVLPMVAVGFVRVVTNPHLTPSGIATKEAIAFRSGAASAVHGRIRGFDNRAAAA